MTTIAAEKRSGVIYLDHAATTPPDPDVISAMLSVLTDTFGNPSSSHHYGRAARAMVERGRADVAELVGADPNEIVFTSGATESNALAVLGLGRPKRNDPAGHVVAGAAEHKSVLAAVEQLEREGVAVTLVPPRRDGRTAVEDVLAATRPDTRLVSLMWVNNETGVVNPIADLGEALRASCPGTLLHTDATQAIGKLSVDLARGSVDALSMSAHKLYGPKGVGALYLRSAVRTRLVAMTPGGGQEGGLRGGTPNVAGIVGFATAARLAVAGLEGDAARIAARSQQLLASLRRVCPGLVVHGEGVARVPGILSVVLRGSSAAGLLARLVDTVALSSGSACSGGASDVSHVLHSMGVDDGDARATLRFSLGRDTTENDVVSAVAAVAEAVVDLADEHARAAAATATRVPGLEARSNASGGPGFVVEPIGAVVSTVEVPAYIEWGEVVSRIVLDPRWASALDGLEGYSHVVVVSWLHHVSTTKLRHVPQGLIDEVPEVGMLACRCPYRPNPIATSTVRLLAVEGDHLLVRGLDAVDGTPVLDVKPYTPQFDAPVGPVSVPSWVGALTY